MSLPILLLSNHKDKLDSWVASNVKLEPNEIGKNTLPESIINLNEIHNYVDGLPKSSDELTIELKEIKDQDNVGGALSIVIEYSAAATKTTKQHRVLGFKTQDMQDYEDLQNFANNPNNIHLVPTPLGTQTLPENIKKIENINVYVTGFKEDSNSISYKAIKILNHNNDTGSLTLLVEFSKGKHKLSKEIEVLGFRTTAQQNAYEVNQFVNNLNVNIQTSELGQKTLPESITTLEGFDKYITNFPESQNNIQINVVGIKNQNNNIGFMTIVLEFSRSGYSTTREYTVNGFKTTYMQNQDDVNDFINNLNTNFIPTELGTKTLPTNINDVTKLSSYVSNLPTSANDVEVELLSIVDKNNNDGTLTIEIKFAKEQYQTTKTYLISGFKTIDMQNNEELNEFLDGIQNLQLSPTEIGKKVLPSDISLIDTISVFVKDIPIGTNGINVEVIQILNQNNNDGSLDLKIRYSKGSRERFVTYHVVGFKDNYLVNKEIVDNFIDNNQISLSPTELGTKTLPLTITNPNKITDYVTGFIDSTDGINIRIKEIVNQNNNEGSLDVVLEFSKGTYIRPIAYNVKGFKTTSAQNKDDINEYLKNLNINMTASQLGQTTLPENITDVNTIAQYIDNIPTGLNGINVEVIEIFEQRNSTGVLKVMLKYSKGQEEVTRPYIVNNFRTQAQQNQIDVDEFRDQQNVTLQSTELGKRTLPSNITAINKIHEYVQNIPKSTKEIVVDVTRIIAFDDNAGTLEIEIKFTKEQQFALREYKIQNFKTTAQQNVDDVNSVLDPVLIPTALGIRTLPQNIIDINNIRDYIQGIPGTFNGITTIVKEINLQDNDSGTLNVVLEFSKGNAKRERTIKVTGFKTTNLQNKDDLDEFLTNSSINPLPSKLGTQTLPSKITDPNTINDYVQGIPNGENGVNVNVTKIHSQDDNNGILKLDIEFSKGNHSIVKTYEINGFITVSRDTLESIQNVMDNLKLTANIGSQKILPQLVNMNNLTSYVSGIQNQQGVNVTVKKIVELDDSNGIIRLNMGFEKNGTEMSREYVVTGFWHFDLSQFSYETTSSWSGGANIRLTKYISKDTDVFVPSRYTKGNTTYYIVDVNNDLLWGIGGYNWLTSFYMDQRFTKSFNWSNFFEDQTNMHTITLSPAQNLGEGMFRSTDRISKLTLGPGVTSVPFQCFKESNMTATLDLTNTNIERVEEDGFIRTYRFGNVYFPSTIRYLGLDSFKQSDAWIVDFSKVNGYLEFGTQVFYKANVKTLTLGENITKLTVKDYVFYEAPNLKDFDASKVRELYFNGQEIFAWSKLYNIHLPKSGNYSAADGNWMWYIEKYAPNGSVYIYIYILIHITRKHKLLISWKLNNNIINILDNINCKTN